MCWSRTCFTEDADVKKFFMRLLNMSEDERRNVTTIAMMGGMLVMSAAIGAMTWVARYSWKAEALAMLAPAILDGLFHVTYGLLGMLAIMTITQAAIALGGKIKGKLGAAEFEASSEHDDHVPRQPQD